MAIASDLSNMRFGRLLAIERDVSQKWEKTRWWCRCDCGRTVSVRASSLKSGMTHSCGCIRHEQADDLIGQRFGRLTVIARDTSKHNDTRAYWICRCDCGNVGSHASYYLRTGQAQSCGCYSRSLLPELTTKHGGKGTRLYTIWKNMKQRCLNSNSPRFADYGGRGIQICAEWIDDFAAFREWALANGYRDDLTIDRIDVNSNYEPANCRWATYKEQAQNQRPRKRRNMNATTI